MGRLRGLTAVLVGIAAGISGSADAAEPRSGGPKPVLELFTSQGCSSCPPADAVLGDYAARDDVIALSLPVDYWDRLGWKDTFGQRSHSDRQRDYARRRGDGEVYTPQVVVNGRLHVIGSSASAIETAIAASRAERARADVLIGLGIEGTAMRIEVGAGTPTYPATVWLALVQTRGSVAIGRGENGGRKITYHNIVRSLRPVGRWTGSPVDVRIPEADVLQPGIAMATVLLQEEDGGAILGAAEIAVPSNVQ